MASSRVGRFAKVEEAMVAGNSGRLGVSQRRTPAWPGAHECPVWREERAMSKQNIIRAWKDEAYRRSLSDAERALLPENPAGLIELTDAELGAVTGGQRAYTLRTELEGQRDC
jgi:mersacidin/lichenicidin family type 2 lantibiotic